MKNILGENYQDFRQSINSQIIDFMKDNKLEPIKIFLNYFDQNSLVLADQIASFYNIQKIDLNLFYSQMLFHKEFLNFKNFLIPAKIELFEKLLTFSLEDLFSDTQKNFQLI